MTVEIIEQAPTAPAVSALSWAAILGGALVAIAVTLVLFSLGSGLGFAAASPWGDVGVTAAHVGVFAGIWLIVVQWLASATGGYLTGRLRTRWTGTHSHEVFFRDTAHGFLTWSLATVTVAAIAAAFAAASAGGAVSVADKAAGPTFAYDADALYRSLSGDPAALAGARLEAERIFAAATVTGGFSPEDISYLVASASNRAGVSPAEAQRRVDAISARERQAADDVRVAADKARKAAATMAILTTLSMLVGAFIACVAAALGGRQRDEHL
jgi:hypothetical protein